VHQCAVHSSLLLARSRAFAPQTSSPGYAALTCAKMSGDTILQASLDRFSLFLPVTQKERKSVDCSPVLRLHVTSMGHMYSPCGCDAGEDAWRWIYGTPLLR
jgi:hypothetical protein